MTHGDNVVAFRRIPTADDLARAERDGYAFGAEARERAHGQDSPGDAIEAELDAGKAAFREKGRSEAEAAAWHDGFVRAVVEAGERLQAQLSEMRERFVVTARQQGAATAEQAIAAQPPGFDPECMAHRRVEATLQELLRLLRADDHQESALDLYRKAF